jgi:hypothetical protein
MELLKISGEKTSDPTSNLVVFEAAEEDPVMSVAR